MTQWTSGRLLQLPQGASFSANKSSLALYAALLSGTQVGDYLMDMYV